MGDIMNKTKTTIRTVFMVIMLAVGCCSLEISARNNGNRSNSILDICARKVPQIALLAAKGIVVGCSAYLIWNNIKEAVPACKRLLNSNFNTLGPFTDLLKKSCTIAGLALLVYKSGNSCLDDLARL